MLGNIASYLMGLARSIPEEDPQNTRVTATEGEDDWLVVDALPRSRSNSRSSNLSSLGSEVEATWFVTPPPCFNSTGPVVLETSPLENLLIEHPSMSVYWQASGMGRHSPTPSQESRASSLPPQLNVSTAYHEQMRPRQPRQPLRPTAVNTPANAPRVDTPLAAMKPPQNLLKKAQMAKKVKENHNLTTKYLQRTNKVRETNKRNKRPRRSDHQKNHSGANNNRKCC